MSFLCWALVRSLKMMIQSLPGPSQPQSGSARSYSARVRGAPVASAKLVGSMSRRVNLHASAVVVSSASRRLHPVTVAHVDLTCVAVVRVTPLVTVVAKALVVRQNEASAGSQSDGLGGGLKVPSGARVSAGQLGSVPLSVKPGGSFMRGIGGGKLLKISFRGEQKNRKADVVLRSVNTNGQIPLPALDLDTEIGPIDTHLST
jgi:hypothetical protein